MNSKIDIQILNLNNSLKFFHKYGFKRYFISGKWNLMSIL